MSVPPQTGQAAAGGATGRLLMRNTLYLTVAQVVAVPLSIVTNAMAAQYLGPEAFGYSYLAFTLCAFGFLAVGWGHDAVLPAVIAPDHALAGRMLGSSLTWRAVSSVVVYLVLAVWCRLLHYSTTFQVVLAITSLITALTYFCAACKDTIRGLERTDIPAYAHVGQHVLATTLVGLVLVLGGDLRAALLAQAVTAGLVFAGLLLSLRRAGVGPLSVRWSAIKTLFANGTPFVVFGLAMALQPNVDAIFLSKLAPLEVMGWYGVSRRLLGALLLPASALIGALYPTLCRLHATDKEAFRQTTNDALRSVSLVAVPVALGCALYPDIGVALFSRQSFRPAEDNLRVMSLYLALVYFSMPLGSCILAAGKQKMWATVQCLCIVTSLILDPLLVPIFQRRMGNGGLGLSIATVVSEAIVIGFGVALAPTGLFDAKLRRLLLFTLVAGGAMTMVFWITRSLGPFMSAPLALAAYAGALWLTGSINKSHLATIRALRSGA